jgi:Flp pilus assembly protein TadD
VARAVVVLVVALVFARVVGHEILAYDDRYHTVENPAFGGGMGVGGGLGFESFAVFWRGAYGNLYIPVAYNVWGAVIGGARALGGGMFDARALHGLSVVLHAGCGLLVLSILRRLGLGVVGALAGALVFVAHPLQVESVAWLSEARGLLAAVLAFGAVRVFLGRADDCVALGTSDWLRVWGRVVGSAGLFGLALLSKPSVAPVFVVAGVLAVVWLGRAWKRVAVELVPWAALAVGDLVVTRMLQPGGGLPDGTAVWTRPLIVGDSLGFYVWKLVWPVGLAADYGRTPAVVMRGAGVWAMWLVPVAACVTAVWVGKRIGNGAGVDWKKTLACAAVFVLGCAPVLGLVEFDYQAISTVADRYMYLPMLGVAVWVGMMVGAIHGVGPKAVRIGGVIVLVVLGVMSWVQAGVWRDSVALWSHAVAVRPDARTAQNNLGDALLARGDLEGALRHFRRAMEIEPRFALARANVGWVLVEMGRDAEAREELARAVEMVPTMGRALAGLGLVELRAGRTEDAVAVLARAVEQMPGDADVRTNYGAALMERGDFAGAVREFGRAVEMRGGEGEGSNQARHNLGLAMMRSGDVDGAITVWREALRKGLGGGAGGNVTRMVLADALLKRGDLAEARRLFEALLRVDAQSAYVLNNLGLIAVRMEDVDGAIEYFERAVRADPEMRVARENLANARALKERGSR